MTADNLKLEPMQPDKVLNLATALGASQVQGWLSHIGRWLTEPTARRQPG